MSAHSFSPIDQALQQPEKYHRNMDARLLKVYRKHKRPDVVGLTIPFPGNLYAGTPNAGTISNRTIRTSKLSLVAVM